MRHSHSSPAFCTHGGARLTVPADASEMELEQLALADPAVKAHTAGKPIKKVVVAKGRLVSIVVQ